MQELRNNLKKVLRHKQLRLLSYYLNEKTFYGDQKFFYRGLSWLSFNRRVFFAAVLREGCLFDSLDQQQRKLDPLLSSSMAIIPSAYDNTNNSRELEHLICSFYPNISLRYKRLLYAICCIRNIGRNEHPSYRALQPYLLY